MELQMVADEKMSASYENLLDNFTSLRTGKPSPKILDKVQVDYYGAPCALNQLATVTIPDGSTIMVSPFDKSAIGDIEKALLQADLGMTPNSDGNVVRLSVPPLTQERRKEYSKQASKYGEESKVAIRNARRDCIKGIEKLKTLSKDLVKDLTDGVQSTTDSYVAKVDAATKSKQEDIMNV